MIPDVAADADPDTGCEIVPYGVSTVVGGTSVAAPLYSGLFASLGTKFGFITPDLYQNQCCFTAITQGDNGTYRAGPGPNLAVGWARR
jgi:kumamolisin